MVQVVERYSVVSSFTHSSSIIEKRVEDNEVMKLKKNDEVNICFTRQSAFNVDSQVPPGFVPKTNAVKIQFGVFGLSTSG